MSSLLPDLIQWVTDIVYSFGYPGIAVLTGLGNLHLPVPTKLTLPLAGFLVGQGQLSFGLVLLWTTAVIAALILYAPGCWFSEERLRRFVKRFGRFLFVHESDLDRASELFDQHGGKATLIGRLIPGVGTLISIPAGIYRMPILGWFMFFTVLDTLLWNSALIGLGYALGSQWTLVERYSRIVEYSVLVVILALVARFLWGRRKVRG